MGIVRTWVTLILIVTSFINLILGLILVVEAENKGWPIFILGGTLVSMNAGFALGTACLGVEWVLWLVSFVSLILSIYFAVLITYYVNIRHPEHEERLWTYLTNSGEIHKLEKEHSCCGRDGPQFYTERKLAKIPKSCYATGSVERNEVFKEGCFYLMEEKSKSATSKLLRYLLAITIIGFIHSITAQLLAILLLAQRQRKKYHNAAVDRAFRRAVNDMRRRRDEQSSSDYPDEVSSLNDLTKNKNEPQTELTNVDEANMSPNQKNIALQTENLEISSGSHAEAKTKADVHDEPAQKASIEPITRQIGIQTISDSDIEAAESDSA